MAVTLHSIEAAFDADRALVFGIGGGGDVVGAIPTARLLESHGVETVLGGLTWERAAVDPRPGPRRLDEIVGAERVSSAVATTTGDARTPGGATFAESGVASATGEAVALVDITGGVDGVAEGVDAACDALDVDLVVGSDSGGDALAAGDEPGLRSPLADAVCLGALTQLDTRSILGVFGYGSDGELSVEELDAGVARAASRGGLLGSWGITPRIADEMEAVMEHVTTEASRLPVEAVRGELGERSIRGGERSLRLTPASTVTFYFDPDSVAATSDPVANVRDAGGLEAAHEALSGAGYRTELGYERANAGDAGGEL